MRIAQRCMDRLDLDPSERETVLFLIANHLEISFTLRRDIFDPETVRGFAEKMETPERLKMLTLLTYADIKAVNPDALTPWKAENVFQLYIAAFNYLNHNVDERLRADTEDDHLAQIRSLVPTAGKKLKGFSGRIAQAIPHYLLRYRCARPHGNGGEAGQGSHPATARARPALVRTDLGNE